jgi:hypothetical protein
MLLINVVMSCCYVILLCHVFMLCNIVMLLCHMMCHAKFEPNPFKTEVDIAILKTGHRMTERKKDKRDHV